MEARSPREELSHIIATGSQAEVETKLNTIGISIYDNQGNMKSWGDIFEEIANIWENL